MSLPERRVPCPTCRQAALYAPANPWRPFCSQRCRQVDLGAWANEEFRLPAQPPSDADGADGTGDARGAQPGLQH